MFHFVRNNKRNLLVAAPIIAFATVASVQYSYSDDDMKKKRIVIVGGGTGGIYTSSMLAKQGYRNVTLIEPKTVHYYQPLWTLVGAGIKQNTQSQRPMSSIVDSKVILLTKAASKIVPEKNEVILDDGSKAPYDYLIISTGLQHNWNAIPGLAESVGKPETGVVSIYDYNYCASTWKAIQDFTGGKAIFTMPKTPIKCAGAPQKIMWLFEEYLRSGSRDRNIRLNTSVEFWVPGASMFGIKRYADMLLKQKEARDVHAEFGQELVKIDGSKKIATFKSVSDGKLTEVEFDLLHAVPPMTAPDFIKHSSLADNAGYLDVDKYTLQSKKYKNVFGLGDCTNTPNSKTAAAIMSQGPVLIHNMKQVMSNQPLNGYYDGYGSCPLLIGRNRVILAEFGYDGKIMESFCSQCGKFPFSLIGAHGVVQEYIFGWMKKELFPFVYWNLMPRGMWYGKNGPFEPDVTKKP